jgi:hypothetical protein
VSKFYEYLAMEAYANDACRTVAAQVAEAVGFQGLTQSTADTLAEVLARYIEEVSANACRSRQQRAERERPLAEQRGHRGDRCTGGIPIALVNRDVKPDARQRAGRAASAGAMQHDNCGSAGHPCARAQRSAAACRCIVVGVGEH